MPRIVTYSASKAFINRLSQNLHADERFDEPNSSLSFMYHEVGSVSSNANKQSVTWTRPDADTFAKSVVQAFGSGRQVVVPYAAHAVIVQVVACIPDFIRARAVRNEMKKVLLKDKNA